MSKTSNNNAKKASASFTYITEKGAVYFTAKEDRELLSLAAANLIEKRSNKFSAVIGNLFVKKAMQKNEITKFLTHKEKLILDSIAMEISLKQDINKDNIVNIVQKEIDQAKEKPSFIKKIRNALTTGRQNSNDSSRTRSQDSTLTKSTRSISKTSRNSSSDSSRFL